MPDTKHAQWTRESPRWARCRDAVAGQDAVHDAGVSYLPKLTDQSADEYAAYKLRAPWFGATGRTLDGLVGMIFRKPADLVCPAAFVEITEDITLSGVSLDGLAQDITREVEIVGRCGVLVEFPRVAEQPVSAAQASESNLRSYASLYKTESIINWRVERVNNVSQPVLVVLAETYTERVNQFAEKEYDQRRVLLLTNGVYVQRVYRKTEKGKAWELIEEVTPIMRGKPIPYIPFYSFGPDALSIDCQNPPLIDLVDLNLSHYRTGADLEHGAHFTGLPTPFIAGLQLQDGESIRIGSSTAIVSPDPNAKAMFLEFSGQGLGTLERLLDRKEKQMAAIGARMLAPEKSGVEAADTLSMRHSGETSVLASQANLISRGITEFLRVMAEWQGIAGEVTYQLSTDFIPVGMTAQQLTALVGAWQSGAMSLETLFWNIKQGEMVPAERTFEDEQEAIGDAGPALGMIDANNE